MALAPSQPYYFPRASWWRRMQLGTPVILDDVQHSTYTPSNRTLCTNERGEDHFLTIPIRKSQRSDRILEIEVSRQGWSADHRNKICSYWLRAPHSVDGLTLFDAFDSAHSSSTSMLDVVLGSISESAAALQIDWHPLRSSTIDLGGHYLKSRRLVRLCEVLGDRTLVLGQWSRRYIEQDLPLFESAGIELRWAPSTEDDTSDFELSVLDIFAWKGKDAAMGICK